MLQSVPWASLQPGDIVNIHFKPGGYKEKIQISASGTAGAHIVIRGIPDPGTGALPIIDGKDAIEMPSFDPRHPKFTEWSLILVSPRNTGYVYGTTHVSFVDIETLDVRNATYTGDGSITYTDKSGTVRGYGAFASGIYIEWAHDLTVRGCEISNCGNGVFANSKNGAAQSSARLLIEGNYFHDNSNPRIPDPNNPDGAPLSNGYGEHHCYIESAGAIYQYNRFGGHRPGAHGTAIKDRSSGQIIRYNEFDMTEQSNVLALLDPQGGSGYIDAQPDYLDSFVYGNLVTINDYAGGISAFWWGAFNSSSSYAAQHRGTLHFYHNTIISHHKGVSLFFLPDATYAGGNQTFENVDCRNNIFFCDTALQNNIYNAMHFYAPGNNPNGGGNIMLGNNWISPNWLKEAPLHAYSGQLIGVENLLVGNAGVNEPGFVDMANRDYQLVETANSIDAAGPLATAALTANDVLRQYSGTQSSIPRTTRGGAPDLGALESDAGGAGPGHIRLTSGLYTVREDAGTVSISLQRVNGSAGQVSVDLTTSDISATAPGDYTQTLTTVTWADGDAAPKSAAIAIRNDVIQEPSEAFRVTMTNPTGGASLGTLTTATVVILDDDTPPGTPNRRPIAQSQSLQVLLNTATPITLSGFDGDGDLLTYSVVIAPYRGTLSGTPPNLTYTPNNNISGPDFFYFVANDGRADSLPAIVNIAINTSGNAPPTVSLLTPANGTWAASPTNILLSAQASDSDGIYAVEFYEGTNTLKTLLAPPYTFTWTNPPPGTYTLVSKAYDTLGRRGVSQPVIIRVLADSPKVRGENIYGMLKVSWPKSVPDGLLQESDDLIHWRFSTNTVSETSTERNQQFEMPLVRFYRLLLW